MGIDQQDMILDRLSGVLDRFDQQRLLVVGDVMLDEYLSGSADRLSAEAPVPIVHVANEDSVLGGSGNVAMNVLAMGARCDWVGVIGNDEAGRRIQSLAQKGGLDTGGLVTDGSRPTTHKTRVQAHSQQMLRFDRESTQPLGGAVAERVLEAVSSAAANVDGVLFVDYAKGLFSDDFSHRCVEILQERALPLAADPKDSLDAFRGVHLIKPNLAEAEALTGVQAGAPPELGPVLTALAQKMPGVDFAVTQGRLGMAVQEAGKPFREVRTWSRDVFDVQGAGDTTLASLWLSRLCGATLEDAAMIANAAAGVVVEKVGTAVVSREEIRSRLPRAVAAFQEGE
ncbi:MAG: PfkB family carbohydrate kinase [Myxococcota bacterium]|nr:PfkB family carbohydrate kinase [Myxococcota bacterium]